MGDEDEVPVELKLGNGLFYVGIVDHDDLTIELSALLYLGAESTSEDEQEVPAISQKIAEHAPDDIIVETTVSVGTDIWAAMTLESSDLKYNFEHLSTTHCARWMRYSSYCIP